jgi:hypothetical protein
MSKLPCFSATLAIGDFQLGFFEIHPRRASKTAQWMGLFVTPSYQCIYQQ